MKQTLFILATLFCFSAHSKDCKMESVTLESPAEYLLSVAKTLGMVKVELSQFQNLSKKKNLSTTHAMVGAKDLKAAYACAASFIGSYKKSKENAISESSERLSASFQGFSSGLDSAIADLKAIGDHTQEISAGEKADRDSDRIIADRKKWYELREAVRAATLAAVVEIDPKTYKATKQKITKAERDLILKELKSKFKLPMKSDILQIDDVANLLYETLSEWSFKKI